MEVEVLPHKPLDVITKRPVDGGQYQIRVDGRLAGFIGYHDGAAPVMHLRFSPMELEEIEAKVDMSLKQKIGKIVQPIPKPQKTEDKAKQYGDFD